MHRQSGVTDEMRELNRRLVDLERRMSERMRKVEERPTVRVTVEPKKGKVIDAEGND